MTKELSLISLNGQGDQKQVLSGQHLSQLSLSAASC